MKKINLGCGSKILSGYENYDIKPITPINKTVKYLNLNNIPLPFKNNSIDEIILNQVLEHLNINPLDFMEDIFRILKPNGIIKIGLPVNSPMIYHVRQKHFNGYFNPITNKSNAPEKYINGEFILLKTYYKNLSVKKIIGRIFNLIRSLISESCYYELKKP